MVMNIRINPKVEVDIDGDLYKYDAGGSGGGGGGPTGPTGPTPPNPTPGAAGFFRSANYQIASPEEQLHFVAGTQKWQTKTNTPGQLIEGHITVPPGVSSFQMTLSPLPTGPVGNLTCEVNGVPVYGNDVISYGMAVGPGPIHIKSTTDSPSPFQLETKFY